MKFSHNFKDDCDTIISAISNGEKFALARYADGEAAIMFGGRVNVKSDGWRWKPKYKSGPLKDLLLESIDCGLPGWHVGISAADCHFEAQKLLMPHVGVPLNRVTSAEVFMFLNFQRHFRRFDLTGWLTVGHKAEIDTPYYPNAPEWSEWEKYLDIMLSSERPIALCAGPWSCVLAHQFWNRRQDLTVVDFGSAISVQFRGKTRRFHHRARNEQTSMQPRMWK